MSMKGLGMRIPQPRRTTVTLLVIFIVACAALAAPAPAKITTAHGGVSLTYDSALAPEVRAETAPAAPLEQASDKPDGVYPEHVIFNFVGGHPYGEPVVSVSSVAEYLKAFSVSPGYVKDAERTLNDLRRLIRRRPAALTRNVPQLPFLDGTEIFHARVHYLRFRGGAGVVFLTQGQQDDNLISNAGVGYEFHGLTDDGRFYVRGLFPVGAPVLADSSTGTHEGYTLPLYPGRANARDKRRYAAYVEGVRRKLERLRPEQFQPDLRLYDELLSSLDIRK